MEMKLNIIELMSELSEKRKVFHSEDDFKFSLAWLIKEKIPEVEIFLERPTTIQMQKRDGSEFIDFRAL